MATETSETRSTTVRQDATVCWPVVREYLLPAQGRRRPRRRLLLARLHGLLWSSVSLGLLGICLLGIAVRLTVQDARTGWATIYYATPPAVLAALAGAAAGPWFLRKRWLPGVPTLLVALSCATWAYETGWQQNPPAAITPGGHVLFWNAARGALGWDHVAADIRQRNPDIVALVEAGTDVPSMTAFWERELPGYRCAASGPSEITVLSRDEIQHVVVGQLHASGYYEHFAVRVGDQWLHLIVVDFQVGLYQSRRAAAAALVDLLASLDGEPVLVLGDLNTPADSPLLRGVRDRFTNAFEVAGAGWEATWPVPLPVLTLDQAWFNDGVRVARCTHGWSPYSDHRPVELGVSVAP